MLIDIERTTKAHIVQIDEAAPLRVAANAAMHEQDHALLLNASSMAQTASVKKNLATEADKVRQNADLYTAIANAVGNNTFAIFPEHNPRPNDRSFIPEHVFLCDGRQIPNTSLSTLSTVFDLVMTPKEVGHLLERGKATEALQEGRIVQFFNPQQTR